MPEILCPNTLVKTVKNAQDIVVFIASILLNMKNLRF